MIDLNKYKQTKKLKVIKDELTDVIIILSDTVRKLNKYKKYTFVKTTLNTCGSSLLEMKKIVSSIRERLDSGNTQSKN